MRELKIARLRRQSVSWIGVFVLSALILSGAAARQDKKESPPVTSSLAFRLSGYT